jgi:hypothetical protein
MSTSSHTPHGHRAVTYVSIDKSYATCKYSQTTSVLVGQNGVSCKCESRRRHSRSAGYHATRRLISDWVSLGLLDYPKRRGRGRGAGAAKAHYSGQQRQLFLSLLAKRSEVRHVKPLAQIPVFIWMYWGVDYVPLRQARRAFMTWLGDVRDSKDGARRSARALLGQLDHPGATETARRTLLNVMAEIAYTGHLDAPQLRQAVAAVFKPDGKPRALGNPAAPLNADVVVTLLEARLTAVHKLQKNEVSDEQLVQARNAHRLHMAEYVRSQPDLATSSDSAHTLYEPVTQQATFDSCCRDLLTVLGLRIMHTHPI